MWVCAVARAAYPMRRPIGAFYGGGDTLGTRSGRTRRSQS
jgi:hypothetical protein